MRLTIHASFENHSPEDGRTAATHPQNLPELGDASQYVFITPRGGEEVVYAGGSSYAWSATIKAGERIRLPEFIKTGQIDWLSPTHSYCSKHFLDV